MTEPSYRQQMMRALSDMGLPPTAENMQRVRQLMMNDGSVGGAGSGDGGAGGRTLDRISGTSAPPAKVHPPKSRPTAAQGNQAGPNSRGPAAQPDNIDMGKFAPGFLLSEGQPTGDETGVTAVAEPPLQTHAGDDSYLYDMAVKLGLPIAGIGGAGLLARKALRGQKPDWSGMGRPAETGDIYTDENAGTEMGVDQKPVDPTMKPGELGGGETAGTEMDPRIKPDVAREMQPGDIAEEATLRRMMGGDLGVTAPPVKKNPILEDMLRGTNRRINEGMTVVPNARQAQIEAAPGPGSAEGAIMPDEPLSRDFGEPMGETSMGADLSAGDQAKLAKDQQDADKARMQREVKLTNTLDDRGFGDGIRATNGDTARTKKLIAQMSPKEFTQLQKIIQRDDPTIVIKNEKDMLKALRGIYKAFR